MIIKKSLVCFYKHNVICFSFYNLRFKRRKESILKTVNENNEETKMYRKSEIYFYLEVALEVSPRTTSSPS